MIYVHKNVSNDYLYICINAFIIKYTVSYFCPDAFKTSYNKPKTRLMNILMQLRKCVNHPYLFDGEYYVYGPLMKYQVMKY